MPAVLVAIYKPRDFNALYAQKGAVNMSKERIIDRIRKLMKMTTERGATEAESQTAALMAQKLLLENNLHMQEVGDLDKEPEEAIEMDGVIVNGKPATIGWKKHLLWRISKPLQCRAAYSSWQKKMHIVGKKSSIEVVSYLYMYLSRTIEALSEEHVLEQQAEAEALMDPFLAGNKRQAKYSFAFGCASTIGRRLEEQFEKVAKSSSSTTALALRQDQALEEKFKDFFPRLTQSRISGGQDGRSRSAGAEAGSKIPLNMGVNSKGGGQRQIT